MPLVSVVIATYNRADHVGAAVASVLGQSFGDLELIVVDDGSTDGTDEVIARFGSSVTYYRQQNAERAAARNRGLAMATGTYVGFLDSDDLWMRDKLECEVARFRERPEAGLVYCNAVYIGEDDAVVGRVQCGPFEGDVLDRIARWNFVPLGASLIRRELLVRAGGFAEDRALSGSEDWEAWVRLAALAPFYRVRSVGLKYRVHAGSTVGNPAAMERSMLRAWELIFSNERLGERIARHRPYARAYVHLTLSNLHRVAGDRSAAWRHLSTARRLHPRTLLGTRYWATAARLAAGRRTIRILSTAKRQLHSLFARGQYSC